MLAESPGADRRGVQTVDHHSKIGRLVFIHGLLACPELNETLGLVLSHNGERFRVRRVTDTPPGGGKAPSSSSSCVAIKPENLVLWRECAAIPEVESMLSLAATHEEIENARPAKLLLLMKNGCILSKCDLIAHHCIGRAIKFISDEQSVRERMVMVAGGFIEMVVQSIDVHMDDCAQLLMIFTSLTRTMAFKEEHDAPWERVSQIKDRAIDAGLYPRIAATLAAHTQSAVLCSALEALTAAVGHIDCAQTEARRIKAASLLSPVARIMKLHARRCAVQHLCIQAIHVIVARNKTGDISAAAARADDAIRFGLHEAIIKAIGRYGHIAGEDGTRCTYKNKLEITACSTEGDVQQVLTREVTTEAPGSVFVSGCRVLKLIVHGGPRNDQRIKSLNDESALKAIAVAVGKHALFADFNVVSSKPREPSVVDIVTVKILQPLIVRLIGKWQVGAGDFFEKTRDRLSLTTEQMLVVFGFMSDDLPKILAGKL